MEEAEEEASEIFRVHEIAECSKGRGKKSTCSKLQGCLDFNFQVSTVKSFQAAKQLMNKAIPDFLGINMPELR